MKQELITPDSATQKLSNWKTFFAEPQIQLRRLKAEQARRRLFEFVMQGWHVLEPSATFVDGIHVEAICEHLQAVTEGRLRNLIINVPSGHAKSLLSAGFGRHGSGSTIPRRDGCSAATASLWPRRTALSADA